MRKIAGIAAGVVAGAAGATGVALVTALRRPVPRWSGTLAVPGLGAPVEVLRDRWGVPHVYARSNADLFMAQGYLHAQDRLWQMELQRRTGHGQLAELFGPIALDTDRFVRVLGFGRVARREAVLLDGAEREVAEAYCRGVNACIAQQRRRLPLEFVLLGHRPQPWESADLLVWGKMMALTLSMNWTTEVLRARIVAAVGAERAAAIDPTYPLHWPLTVPPGLDYAASLGTSAGPAADEPLLGRQGGEPGSNAWVVGGARTESGGPLLANDPHLALQMPSLWYEMHLEGGDYAVAGATIPGAPGVIIGHNARVAWGVTNGMIDVQDLYSERFDPADPQGRRYEFRGAWEEAEVVREVIVVRDKPRDRRTRTETVEVRITRHGPIVSELIPRADGQESSEPLALRWTALEPGRLHAAVLGINRARDWGEFRAALADWTVPPQNFVYADVEGQIGYALGGDIPVRAQGDGLLPVPGWTGEWEWAGIIPPEENPHALNPPEGFVATANNRIVGDDFGHPVIGEWATSYRVSRIREMLLRTPRHTVESFARIQADRRSAPGLAWIELAREGRLPVAPGDRVAADARAVLAAWDGVLSADSVGGLVATVLCQRLLDRAYREIAGPLGTVTGLGAFVGMPGNAYRQRALPNLLDSLLGADPGWLADGDDPEAIIADAWAATVAALRDAWGDDVAAWRYGLAHRLTLRHPLAINRLLARWLNRGPISTGGDGETVNMGGLNVGPTGLVSYAAPSYRQILDPTDWDRSCAIHPTGQSGHPASPHYADFFASWLTGEYHPLPWTRGAVEKAAAHRLTLAPSSVWKFWLGLAYWRGVAAHIGPTRALEDLVGLLSLGIAVRPHGEKDAALLDALLVAARVVLGDTFRREGADESAGRRADPGTGEGRADDTRADNRADAGDHQRADADQETGHAAEQRPGDRTGPSPLGDHVRVLGHLLDIALILRDNRNLLRGEAGILESVERTLGALHTLEHADHGLPSGRGA